MSNPNPRDARTYYPAPTLWKYDASSNTTWFPIRLNQFPQSVDYTGAV